MSLKDSSLRISVRYVLFLYLDKKSAEAFFQDPHPQTKSMENLTNPLAGELGVKSVEDLDRFVNDVLPNMKLVSETCQGLKLKRPSSPMEQLTEAGVCRELRVFVVCARRPHPKKRANILLA